MRLVVTARPTQQIHYTAVYLFIVYLLQIALSTSQKSLRLGRPASCIDGLHAPSWLMHEHERPITAMPVAARPPPTGHRRRQDRIADFGRRAVESKFKPHRSPLYWGRGWMFRRSGRCGSRTLGRRIDAKSFRAIGSRYEPRTATSSSLSGTGMVGYAPSSLWSD